MSLQTRGRAWTATLTATSVSGARAWQTSLTGPGRMAAPRAREPDHWEITPALSVAGRQRAPTSTLRRPACIAVAIGLTWWHPYSRPHLQRYNCFIAVLHWMKINFIYFLMNSFNKTEISFITMQAIFPDDFHFLSDYYFLNKTSLHLLLHHFRACVSLSGTTCMATPSALWPCPPFPTVPPFHSGRRQVHLITCHLWWNIGKYAINVWCVWLKSYKKTL